jgi:hypothetical protein
MPSTSGAQDVLRACEASSSHFRRSLRFCRLLAALLTCSAVAQSARGATSATWLGGFGSWTDPNWSGTMFFPTNGSPGGATYSVFIDGGSPTTSDVSLSIGVIIDNLSVSTLDTLEILSDGGTIIKMYPGAGTITNAGTIKLELTGGSSAPSIEFDGSGVVGVPMGTLTGGGTVIMTGGSIGGSSAGTETLTTDNTIMGAGSVGAKNLINHGIINASIPMGIMTVSSGSTGSVKNVGTGVAGSGTLTATGGGTLYLPPGTIDNTDAAHPGTISAFGGSEVLLGSFLGGTSLIKGGTLTTDPGSEFLNIKTATLKGVTLSPGTKYVQADGTTTNLEGAITNGGIFNIGSTGMGGLPSYSSTAAMSRSAARAECSWEAPRPEYQSIPAL